MAIDMRRMALAAAQSALAAQQRPAPTERKRKSRGMRRTKAFLLGAGLMTAGRLVMRSRDSGLLDSLEQRLGSRDPRDGDGDEPEGEDFEQEDLEQPEDLEGDEDADYEDEEEGEYEEEPEAEYDEEDEDYDEEPEDSEDYDADEDEGYEDDEEDYDEEDEQERPVRVRAGGSGSRRGGSRPRGQRRDGKE